MTPPLQPTAGRDAARASAFDVAVLVLGYALALGLFAWWGGFRGYDRSPGLVLGTFFGTLVIATIAQYLGFLRGSSLSGRTLLICVVAAPFLLFAWKVGYSSLFDGGDRWWASKPGFRCLRLSMLIGASVLVPAIISRWGSAAVQPLAAGAAMGSAAGAAAWVLVDLWCPVGHPEHVLLGHVLPTLVLTLAGAVVGRLILRPAAGGAR